MSRQAIWNKHEVALLIDTYSKVTAKKAEKIPALIELSRRLRNMAINAGIEIDDTYRNLNGMQWQYSFIEKAFQEKGIGSHMPPKLFLEMVRIYRTQPDIFNAVLLEAYKLSEDPVVAKQTDLRKVEGANMIDNKTEFQGWLQQQPRLKHPVGLIMSVQSECSDYAVARHISRVAFWDMTDSAQYMDVARKLQGLRLFRVMHRKTALTFDKTYIYYSAFLKEKAVQRAEEQAKPLNIAPAPVVSVTASNSTVEIKAPAIDDKSPLMVDFNSDEKYAYTSPIWFTYFEGERHAVSSWKDLYVRVIQELIYDYPSVFEGLKGKNIATGQRVDFSATAEALRTPKLIRANYYVETNLSAYDIVKHIKLLLDMCNVDYDNLVIEYRQKSDVEENETPITPGNELIRCEADKEIFEKYPILPMRIAEILKAAAEPLSANEIDRRLGQACRMSTLQQILSTVSWVENVSLKYRYIPLTLKTDPAGEILAAFSKWLLETKGTSVATANGYASNLRSLSVYCGQTGIAPASFVTAEPEELQRIVNQIMQNAEFQKYNAVQHNRFSAALKKFLEYRTGVVLSVRAPKNATIKNSARFPYCEQVTAVLREHYPYGFRLESTIDIKRFRRYAEGLDLELPESDDALKTEIKNAGVKIDDKVYLVEADTFDYISNTINALSSDGSNVLFYDCIYDSDVIGMEEHHITSADFLKAIMKHCRQNIFDDLTNIHFAKNFLSLIGEQMERDAVTYEMQRVWGDSQTRVVSEISEQLPMIPEEYVKRYLSGSTSFVWVSDGVYFSMQRFIITEAEENAIVDFVAEECDSKGYASISDVPLGNTAEENYELTDFGLQEAIYNKALVGKYRLNGKILTRENAASLDVVALAKQYLIGKEECTFDEMDKKVTEYAGTRYRYMAYEALYSSMIRVDKERYVAHQYVKFDVDAIDEVLSEMIADRFVAIKEITSFALFPLCGFPWNHYLLESYCYSYSKKFCLKVIGFNDKNAGIIAENDVTDGYNELLSQAAARAKIELSTEAVGQYFFETGYMGKRKFSDLESIVERAKAIREDL